MSQDPDTPPPVRQRNTTPYVYSVAETENRPAYAVLPGEEAEFPALLDGWTAIEPEAKADEPAPKLPSRKRAAAADTEISDGGEPR